jgi:hypothetical protein
MEKHKEILSLVLRIFDVLEHSAADTDFQTE